MLGLKLATITAFVSGVSIFLNKFAVDSLPSPLLFTATKNLLVGLAFALFLTTSGKWQAIRLLNRCQVLRLLTIALIGGSLPFYLFFTGLSHTSAANSAFIQKTLVFWVALFALPLLKERLTRTQALGIALLFLANFTIGGLSAFHFSTGEVMIFVATILWAVEYLIAKTVLPSVDPDLVIAFRMCLGSLILVSAAFLTIPHATTLLVRLSLSQWSLISLTALSLIAYLIPWYRALKHAPATSVTAVLVAATLVTNILSAVFTTHVWTIAMLFQAIFILLGLILLSALPRTSVQPAFKD